METRVMRFAKAELEKYLEKLNVSAEISLELFDVRKIDMELADPEQDDAIVISVKDRKGYIAGSNERSVLIGVYRLLEEWGIAWIRPGRDGTNYPAICTAPDVEIQEKAYLRHRIMCIEGTCSKENVLDMVEWLPKVGMNGYYIQFSTGYEFYEKWYQHRLSTAKKPETFTQEMADAFTAEVVDAVKQRGLILQRYGHGWTCRAFGVPDNGWHKFEYEEIPKAFHNVCAMLDGERKCYRNTPLETQLCYSDPLVREAIVNEFAKTALKNPDCDVFHFWLGDWYNNTCECENCRKGNYSDHYVQMANDITERFLSLGIQKKIVIDCSYNAAHPPEMVALKHPEQVILMFAPICRTYAESFPDGYRKMEIPEYQINSFQSPEGVDENLAYFFGWEQKFPGDAVDFDYHLMWDHILDAGGEGIARVLHTDIKHLEALGMNGFISCQLQRNAFPTSISMTAMTKTLWNKNTDFEQLRRKLYADSFGEVYTEELCEYFALLSKAFDIGAIRKQKPYDVDVVKQNLHKALDALVAMEPIAAERQSCENACHRASWEFLGLHARLYSRIAEAILAKLEGEEELFAKLRDEATDLAFAEEDTLQPVLDCHFFRRMTVERIEITKD